MLFLFLSFYADISNCILELSITTDMSAPTSESWTFQPKLCTSVCQNHGTILARIGKLIKFKAEILCSQHTPNP